MIERASKGRLSVSKDFLNAFPKKQLESGMTIEELEEFFNSYKEVYSEWRRLAPLWIKGLEIWHEISFPKDVSESLSVGDNSVNPCLDVTDRMYCYFTISSSGNATA